MLDRHARISAVRGTRARESITSVYTAVIFSFLFCSFFFALSNGLLLLDADCSPFPMLRCKDAARHDDEKKSSGMMNKLIFLENCKR